MTAKEEKKALGRLYGKATGIVVMCEIMLFIEALVLVGVFILLKMNGEVDWEYMTGPIVLIAIIVVEMLFFIYNLLGQRKHCRILKEKYEALPSHKQKELLMLAHKYRKKAGVCFNENYIYGIMSETRENRKKATYIRKFLYVDIRELSWIYKIENSIVMVNSYTNQPSSVHTGNDDKICFFTRDGKCFQGGAKYTDTKALVEAIRSKNPSCKIGYKK